MKPYVVLLPLALLLDGCYADKAEIQLPAIDSTYQQREKTPDFTAITDIPSRKAAFFAFIRPLVEAENKHLQKLRTSVMALKERSEGSEALGDTQRDWLQRLAEHYRVSECATLSNDCWQTLLRRVDRVPVSLALAQAANESAWGTSRFARLANNYFGQWCFRQGCGLVPLQRNEGASHEVAAFDDAAASVRAYLHNLNSHDAFGPLRQLRQKARTAQQPVTGTLLAQGLDAYSERGEEYIRDLQAMIRHNKLERQG